MFWILVAALLLLTRVPLAAQYLSIDNVNLALALDHFDPALHQPQPPGYPLFVFFARILNYFIRDPETTFLTISVAVSGLCLPLLHALAKRMFGDWAAKAAVLLLLVNAVFWHSGLDGPLRPNLALFSLLTAYCSWRAWEGERSFVYWGAAALGIGSGVRPDLLAFLAPLWLLAVLGGARPIRHLIAGGGMLAGIVVIWVAGLAYAVGGFGAFVDLFGTYTVEQSRPESVVLGGSAQGWLRQINRLVIWNALAVFPWIWAAPVFLLSRKRQPLFNKQTLFLAVWLIPGLVVQALIHVAAPGHTLFSIPALCLIGGYVLQAAIKRPESGHWFLAVSVAVSVMLFMNVIPLPAAGSPGGLSDAVAVGTFESSLANIRWLDDIHGGSLAEVEAHRSANPNHVIIAQDVQRREWFLNWRIARFYYPEEDIRVLADQKNPPEVFTVRGAEISESTASDPPEVIIQTPARILWLLGNDTELRRALSEAGKAHGGSRVLYTDIPAGSEPFLVMDLRITPHDGIQ
jgi:4-amino-4-deoxy-L-arabinose transferase-like glycosyltransferase